MRAGLWIYLVAAVTFGIFSVAGAQAATVEPLEIVTKSGVQVFSVEMATTEEEKTTGSISRRPRKCRCG